MSISFEGEATLQSMLVSLDTRFITSHEEVGTIIDIGQSFQSLAIEKRWWVCKPTSSLTRRLVISKDRKARIFNQSHDCTK